MRHWASPNDGLYALQNVVLNVMCYDLLVGRLVTSKCYADYVGVRIISAAAKGGSSMSD